MQSNETPLPEQIRPLEFHQLLGQEHIWASGKPLRSLVESDSFSSLILWGPPGTGKTTLACLIGRHSNRELVLMSATEHGVKAIREQLHRSEIRRNHGERSLLLFMDEIHRLSKSQQDVLLPALEKGTIKFIGATTENPSFEVNQAILSRSMVFALQRLSEEALQNIIRRAMDEPSSPHQGRCLDQDVIEALARSADGDGRQALNLVQAILSAVPPGSSVSLEQAKPYLGQILQKYDKNSDQHYDTISAFIKSIRASQVDAAVYYLARMIEAGEDPMFIARRLVIAASEDVGNANPTALLMATSGLQAVHQIGYPEARIILSQVTTYLASSPKSNRSYLAIGSAQEDARRGSLPIPLHLRNAPSKLMKEFGYGKGYIYAHDHPQAASELDYLPPELRHKSYYNPLDVGTERQLKENLKRLNGKKAWEND
ncbi:replication-associated recombination protein A [Pseudobacteriovorax antillogorgiicola]|uniref:Replication-associated recombination protein A n=1 Tax=Pseudobacteriovorax antillogorgiicola TaxID=1513793 RepID=A0A1Y6BC03_9BACT|nr:replication-associated recombination protein A [Pseudobacteriovorax antillogorgiicola]TCS58667.1 recombination protein MgsA [Pseudobacteriovorax antillogorgiicola]SME96137.1 Recombination protein MgsA [Pseudobacteriovorax antillogorgiicola]